MYIYPSLLSFFLLEEEEEKEEEDEKVLLYSHHHLPFLLLVLTPISGVQRVLDARGQRGFWMPTN